MKKITKNTKKLVELCKQIHNLNGMHVIDICYDAQQLVDKGYFKNTEDALEYTLNTLTEKKAI